MREITETQKLSAATGFHPRREPNNVWSAPKHLRIHGYVIDAFYNERWACRDTPSNTFDHGGTAYYHASRNCGQACLDDNVYISYDFVVGSQAQADSYIFYSEATLLENHHPSVEKGLYRVRKTVKETAARS